MKEREIRPGYADPRDEYLDALIRLALLDIEEEEAQRLIGDGLEALPPDELRKADSLYQKTKDRIIPGIERRLRRKRRKTPAFAKIVEIAACVVLVIGIAAPIAIANVEAIRVRVMKLLIEIQEDHADLSLIEDENASFDVPEGWKGEYYPSYLPEGFSVTRMFELSNMVKYENGAGDFIEFDELTEDTETGLDTEDAELSYSTVNGQTAFVVEKDEKTTITWSEGKKYFIVWSSLPKKEVFRIAESVILIQK